MTADGDWAGEWDDADSGDYSDGYDEGEAFARSGTPYADRPSMAWWPAARVQGFLDGYEDEAVKSAATRGAGRG